MNVTLGDTGSDIAGVAQGLLAFGSTIVDQYGNVKTARIESDTASTLAKLQQAQAGSASGSMFSNPATLLYIGGGAVALIVVAILVTRGRK